MRKSMKRYRISAILLVGLCLSLLISACSPGGASTGGTPTAGTPAATSAVATSQPTAQPPLAALPTITNALCQQLMTVAEANTIVQPPAPAATIVSYNTDDGGSCNYVASQTRVPLIIYFLRWTGPVPIPQSDIAAVLAQASGASKITINQATPVDGVGVQAEFVSATATGQGFTGSLTIFYVLEGPFFFDCFSFGPLTGEVLATQTQLQACATQVDSRLR